MKFSNDKEMVSFAVKTITGAKDYSKLICSDSLSLNGKNLPDANGKYSLFDYKHKLENILQELLEDAYAFCSSFSISHDPNVTHAGEFYTI